MFGGRLSRDSDALGARLNDIGSAFLSVLMRWCVAADAGALARTVRPKECRAAAFVFAVVLRHGVQNVVCDSEKPFSFDGPFGLLALRTLAHHVAQRVAFDLPANTGVSPIRGE